MSKYIVDGSDLTSVADAIRSKGETTASLEFPSGFVDAIGDISGGGSNSKFVDLIDRSITTVTAEDLEGAASIGENAFKGCTRLSDVTIPDNISSIGSYAFYGCTSLENAIIQYGVTTINNYAFQNCTSLTSIVVPESVAYIREGAFYECSSLLSITLPNSLVSIDYDAFNGCTSLNAVHISDIAAWCQLSFGADYNNPLYYAHNLYLNDSLIRNLVIPQGVTSIGDRVFQNCLSITSVLIPDSVSSIGQRAFTNCAGITSMTCESVTPPILTTDATVIFSGTYPIYVPENSVSTYQNANRWSSIRSRIKPLISPTELKFHLTSATTQNLYLTQSASNAVSIDWGDGTITNPTTTSVNASHSYSKAGDYIVKIECAEGSTWSPGATISSTEYALLGANSGKSLSYPTLTEVKFGYGAKLSRAKGMAYCTGLTKVTIPQSASSVASDAFTGCTVVDTIITGLGFNVASSFNNSKTTLKTITISGNTSSAFNFPSNAFDGCTALTGVYISNLQLWLTIYFGNDRSNPLRYANNLYLNNTLVTSVDVPQTITSINSYAFYNYTKLTNITLHQPITSLRHYAFYGCTGLTNVVIPDSITSIGTQTFSSCTNLASVTLSSAITTIPSGAFGGCTSLTTFISKAVNPPSISDITAFIDVPDDCAIYVPAESVEAYKSATGWSTRAAYIQAIPTT